MPSASSLVDGRPYKARGVILFPEAITDQRVYRAFGDILLAHIECIPRNVTKNPVAVGFGNTHNAAQARYYQVTDTEWIKTALADARETVAAESAKRCEAIKQREKNHPQNKNAARQDSTAQHSTATDENISAFIDKCDPTAEMVRNGLLLQESGNRYKWHASTASGSCEIVDGIIKIFSNTMAHASPTGDAEPINAHRFYLYQLIGKDMTLDRDKPAIRDYLFSLGYGSDPAAFKKTRAPKLQRTTPSNDYAPEPLQTLDENREQRATDADIFLSADSENETQTVRLHIVRDATGTGKSHTYLTKARQHGKRTLAQLPTEALAAQAVDVAWQVGFTNPFQLVGRTHNWNASGIAEIPVSERTADLFAQNLCIMCDKVQEYIDKRLAPRWYCETKCPFREDCLYLKQYEGLGDRDFIATPTPNLLFNPNFTGYLDALVNSGSEITDTDLALDAMLGTNSDDIKPFDFAILDDYTVDGLYTEIDLRETEFKAIKRAWNATPTGHFAKLVLKAFQKRKPAKIVKRLRKAVDETAEHHAEIADTLTQHARYGIIEYAETPVSSKETKRLLAEKIVRYTDKGTQLIPVDFAAYKELKEKGSPVVHPKKLDATDVGTQVRIPHTPLTAIRAGVPLTELTPTWQAGVTPLELLRLFLESIGNDTDAPIARKFTSATLKDSTEKKPPAILTFSIPPQAPNGILTDIALLSASTEIDDVKRAFDKQDVAISEYTGAPVAWKTGVKVYQFSDARLTTASVFEYPTDTAGKRRLQESPVSLTDTAAKRIAKLNEYAIATEGKTVFISYKDFTEQFADSVNGFDEVAHFDNITGINFDGLKFLVVFGYPKVNHNDVMASARRQYARDTTPLPKQDKSLVHTEGKNKGKPISEYEQLTVTAEITDNGLIITERRYKDARLDAIRKQLSIEKLTQAVGRARLATWRDTITIIFTNAPIPNVSDRANLFTSAGFNISDTPHALETAEQRLTQAEQAGDVDAIMAQQGVSQRTAYEKAKNATAKKAADRKTRNAEIRQRAAAGEKQKDLAEVFGLTQQAVSKIISDAARDQNTTLCKGQLSTLIGTCKELYDSETPHPPCVDAASPAASPGLADTPSNLQSDAAEPKVTQPNPPRDTRIIELHQAEHSNRKIAEIMTAEEYEKVSEGTVRRVVTNHTARQAPENAPENEPQPIPPSEYRHLTETAARAELERLTAEYNYNAAAILRRIFRDKNWKL